MLRNLGILSVVLCTSLLLVMVTGAIDKPAIELIPGIGYNKLDTQALSGNEAGENGNVKQYTGGINLTYNDDKTPLAKRSQQGASSDCAVRPSPEVTKEYVHFPHLGYYKLHTQPKTWNQARKTCIGEGAHLAILNSQREAQALTKMFKETFEKNPSLVGVVNNNLTWLGVHDLFEKGDWTTVLGDPLKSTKTSDLIRSGWNTYICAGIWDKQPDYRAGQRNCATLIRQCATMDDIDCYDNKLSFICERPVPCPKVLSN